MKPTILADIVHDRYGVRFRPPAGVEFPAWRANRLRNARPLPDYFASPNPGVLRWTVRVDAPRKAKVRGLVYGVALASPVHHRAFTRDARAQHRLRLYLGSWLLVAEADRA